MTQRLSLALAALVVVCVASVTACTQSNPSTPSPAVASGSTAGPSRSATVSPLTINITIRNQHVTPNGQRIDVSKGQTVVLNVTSDQDDEVHAHTAGDGYELNVSAGRPARGQFVAADVGSFEVESHHLDQVIAVLNVR